MLRTVVCRWEFLPEFFLFILFTLKFFILKSVQQLFLFCFESKLWIKNIDQILISLNLDLAFLQNSTESLLRMSSSTACIEDLPIEMIIELFRRLPLSNLVFCSMVNKRWHSICTSLKPHRLVATDSDDNLQKWYSNQPVKKEELCELSELDYLARKPLLSNLKYLALAGSYNDDFDLDGLFNGLSPFSQLVHLEFDIPIEYGDQEISNLPALKVLVFHYYNRHSHLSIDCPSLSMLAYREDNENEIMLDVKHPETIKKLDIDGTVVRELASFKNIECLITQQFDLISKATLRVLPKLKELHYNASLKNHLGNFSKAGTVDRMKRALNEFLVAMSTLKGTDFSFTFAGFRLTKSMLNEIHIGVQLIERDGWKYERVSDEYVYMNNYHLLDPDTTLDFICTIDYTRLIDYSRNDIPPCFSQKFTDITKVMTVGPIDADHFLRFLKPLRFLRVLKMDRSELDQEFWDQLPATAPRLTKLKVEEDDQEEFRFRFDFVDKLARLSSLSILGRCLSLESLKSLVANGSIDDLTKCSFFYRSQDSGDRFQIVRYSNGWKVRDIHREIDAFVITQNAAGILTFLKGKMSDLSLSKLL